MFFSGSNISSGYAQNSICIDQELNLNSRHTGRLRRNLESEMPEAAIVGNQLALTLQYMNVDAGLIVYRSCIHFAGACRNSRIAKNDLAHDAADRLYSKTERSYIQQQHILSPTDQNVCLNCGA